MSNSAVPGVYKWVMDDVIHKMSQRFAELGMDVNVLSELQQTWETKIMAMGVASFAPTTHPLHDEQFSLKNPQSNPQFGISAITRDDGLYEYGSPANLAALANSGSSYSLPQTDGPAEDDAIHGNSSLADIKLKSSHLDNEEPHLLPSSSLAHAVSLPNLATQSNPLSLASNNSSTRTNPTRSQVRAILARAARQYRRQRDKSIGKISQLDGNDDDDDDDDDADEPAGGADTSDIGSELDDDDSEDEYAEVDHLVLCQFEKVQRVKNKWKCVLKDGVVNVNGKDYLFNKANCDFEW
ncbi:transcription factor IIA subunit alpha [Batrachochytrium dendrobatidis]|nr:transcription factor IIA subunit alpha [Batrachochytrium dendrobatidis]